MIRISLIVFAFILTGFSIQKQNLSGEPIVNSQKPEIKKDTLIEENSHKVDFYNSWETDVFHPNLVNSRFSGDTVKIHLIDNISGFIKPVNGVVTSEFGWRGGRPHLGTDIDLDTGDSVKAAFSGKVRIAKFNSSYGNVVIIRHPNGLETVYAHLSKLLVKSGEEIECGQIIGLGGNTGHSFGSHLHFEVRFLGKALNSREIIDYATGKIKNEEFLLTKDKVLGSTPKASKSNYKKNSSRKRLAKNHSKKRNSLARSQSKRNSSKKRI